MQDTGSLSLRDLASLMLSISDNAATDIIIARVRLERINTTLQKLGLHRTVVVNDLNGLIASIMADAEVPTLDTLWSLSEAERDARLERCRALHPEHATRTTPFEMAGLLRSIWLDETAPAACAEVRRLLAQQASYRIAVGFPDGVRVQAKSGTLMGRIRNEIGVVTYPDGRRYAIAVFTRSPKGASRQPAIDQAIGAAASLAIEHIRSL